MGHHHHHGGHRNVVPTGWPLALAMGLALAAYGVYDAVQIQATFTNGIPGTGVITDIDRGMTTMEVAGHPCVIASILGQRGSVIRVVYPAGRPEECVVAGNQSFAWSIGAVLGGIAVVALSAFMARRPT